MDDVKTDPVARSEEARGNKVLYLGAHVYAEVSEYKGQLYGSIRRWFQTDTGRWSRTKNGLHMRLDELKEVATGLGELATFLVERERAFNGDDDRYDGEVVPGEFEVER